MQSERANLRYRALTLDVDNKEVFTLKAWNNIKIERDRVFEALRDCLVIEHHNEYLEGW
jgi:hypothetical protein